MVSCFACLTLCRRPDDRQRQRLQALKELEDIQGNFPTAERRTTLQTAPRVTEEVDSNQPAVTASSRAIDDSRQRKVLSDIINERAHLAKDPGNSLEVFVHGNDHDSSSTRSATKDEELNGGHAPEDAAACEHRSEQTAQTADSAGWQPSSEMLQRKQVEQPALALEEAYVLIYAKSPAETALLANPHGPQGAASPPPDDLHISRQADRVEGALGAPASPATATAGGDSPLGSHTPAACSPERAKQTFGAPTCDQLAPLAACYPPPAAGLPTACQPEGENQGAADEADRTASLQHAPLIQEESAPMHLPGDMAAAGASLGCGSTPGNCDSPGSHAGPGCEVGEYDEPSPYVDKAFPPDASGQDSAVGLEPTLALSPATAPSLAPVFGCASASSAGLKGCDSPGGAVRGSPPPSAAAAPAQDAYSGCAAAASGLTISLDAVSECTAAASGSGGGSSGSSAAEPASSVATSSAAMTPTSVAAAATPTSRSSAVTPRTALLNAPHAASGPASADTGAGRPPLSSQPKASRPAWGQGQIQGQGQSQGLPHSPAGVATPTPAPPEAGSAAKQRSPVTNRQLGNLAVSPGRRAGVQPAASRKTAPLTPRGCSTPTIAAPSPRRLGGLASAQPAVACRESPPSAGAGFSSGYNNSGGYGAMSRGGRFMPLYGGGASSGGIGMGMGGRRTPPPPGAFSSASTRLALHDVLSRRSNRSRGGAGGSSASINLLADVDFRPRWRY